MIFSQLEENKGEAAENTDSVQLMGNANVFLRIPAVQADFHF
jgi:hypothetical protein